MGLYVNDYVHRENCRHSQTHKDTEASFHFSLKLGMLLWLMILALPIIAFCQTQTPAPKPATRPPKVEVPKETETGDADSDKEEREAESETQSPMPEPSQAQPANPMTMPEYPTEIVGVIRNIKPFPIEKVHLNEDVPSNSVFQEVRIAVQKAVPVAGNHNVVVEPGAEVALITRDPITQQWVGKTLTGLVRLQGDTRGQQRFLSKSKLVTKKSGTEHSK